MEHLFGELRSLLAQAPSELLWEQICALCDAAVARDAGRFEAEVLPYVSVGLLGWPDRMRAAPKGWIDAIVKEGTHPCGPLVRWIDLDWRPAHDRARLLTAQELRRDVLAVPLLESGFGIKQVHMRRSARHEEKNDALRFGSEVRQPSRRNRVRATLGV